MALPRQNRLKRKKDFEEVFKQGKTVHGSFLFIKFRKTSSRFSRFGLVIGARVAKKAVTRNRIKRILSETLRSRLSSIRDSVDAAVVIKRTNPEDQTLLKEDLLLVLQKANIS